MLASITPNTPPSDYVGTPCGWKFVFDLNRHTYVIEILTILSNKHFEFWRFDGYARGNYFQGCHVTWRMMATLAVPEDTHDCLFGSLLSGLWSPSSSSSLCLSPLRREAAASTVITEHTFGIFDILMASIAAGHMIKHLEFVFDFRYMCECTNVTKKW